LTKTKAEGKHASVILFAKRLAALATIH